MTHCFPPFTNCFNVPTCFPPPPCPPSYYRCSSISGVSKLANFTHYGGCDGANDFPTDNCCKQEVLRRRNMGESRCDRTRKCPPPPTCHSKCIPNCKDLPAQRLRNVDILEELCYYVPGGDENGAMDCYTVDCCGNVEKIDDDGCSEENSGDGLQPVKYSRRQRFSFNDKNPERACHSDPWPFNECEDHCGAGKGNSHAKSKCGGNVNNVHNNGGGGGEARCGGRKYTYCPEEPIDCTEMLPPRSGVYYYDRDRRAFVPEENLPKASEPIEKQMIVPEVEEYELLAEEKQPPPCPPPSIQPVIQPIILPTGGSNCPNPPPCGPCSMPPYPCYPPPNCYPPPPCNPCPPCNPPPCNPCNAPCNPCNPCNAPCNPCNSCNAPCNSYNNNYCNAPCNPCNRPCNPCNPCNRPCNPCNSCNIPPACNPCNPCNPCAPCNPCNPCPPCNPCMPCGPMNPFMNMCGGVLPMVIPMCPQQPGGMGGMPPPPPPPFPFPHNFNLPKDKKKKKKKKSKSSKSETTESTPSYSESSEPTEYETYETSYTDNIVVPGAPEVVLKEMGENIPPNAYPVEMGNDIDINIAAAPAPDERRKSEPPPAPDDRRKSEPPPAPATILRSHAQHVPNPPAPRNVRQSPAPSSKSHVPNVPQHKKPTDGTFVTTIDFPPGEAEQVGLIAIDRKNANRPAVNIAAQLQGGKGDIPPRGMDVTPHKKYTNAGGTNVTSYTLPHDSDGYIHAARYE